MRCLIDLLDEHYEVTVLGRPGRRLVHVGDCEPEPAGLTMADSGEGVIDLGDQSARVRIAVKGETVYVRAFDRTFTMNVVDPVEQAAREAGGRSNAARAPMPGTVVEIRVAAGDQVTKGQPMMTIESMKILTVIAAPRDGEVEQVHFMTGQTFDKNAVLVTLIKKQET